MKTQTASHPATPITSGKSQSPWVQMANKFRKSKGWTRYMMEPVEQLEFEMQDSSLDEHWRVWAAAKRFAWANLSDFCVDRLPSVRPTDAKPKALKQKDLAEILSIPEDKLSKILKGLREIGYLKDHKYIFPNDNVKHLESTGDLAKSCRASKNHSPFIRFKEALATKADEDAKTLTELELERKRLWEEASDLTPEIDTVNKKLWRRYRDYQKLIQAGDNPLGIDVSLFESTD